MIGLLSVLFYDSILDKPPMGVHIWRQADCLSMAQLYQQGSSFLEPEMHLQFADEYSSGKSAGEFPIMYYMVGKYWSVFGFSYLSYRLGMLGLLIISLYVLFLTLHNAFKSTFWALIPTILVYSSPVFAFYGVSFLTDVPAFCLNILACCSLYFYVRSHRSLLLILAFGFFLLAGLIKVSSLIVFVFLMGLYVLEIFGFKGLNTKPLFKNKIHSALGFFIVLMGVFSWYKYADYYNGLHGFKYTFNAIYPIWHEGGQSVSDIFKEIISITSYSWHSRITLVLLPIILIIVLIKFKTLPKVIGFGVLATSSGAFLYFLLWSRLMGAHDYYYTPMLSLSIPLVITAVLLLKKEFQKLYTNKWILGIVCVFALYNVAYCYEYIQYRSLKTSGEATLINSKELSGIYTWTNWFVKETYHPLADEEGLIALGIEKHDKVICLPDQSFNASLHFLNRKGWTNFAQYTESAQLDNLISKGASYLIVLEEEKLKQKFLQPFLQKPLGRLGNAWVFDLKGKGVTIEE